MKLEDQVCSLELAQKLWDLKVEQKSWFFWEQNRFGKEDDWRLVYYSEVGLNYTRSAFTVAELGEMLPILVWTEKYRDGYWMAKSNTVTATFPAGTEADARAKMLIYLIENKLLVNDPSRT